MRFFFALTRESSSLKFKEEQLAEAMFSGNDIKRALRISLWEGVFATIHGTVTTGAFLAGFALLLSANDFQIALLTSIPLLTQLLQIYSMYAVEKVGSRKWISAIFSFTGRTLWGLAVLIPMIPWMREKSIVLFIILFLVISAMMSLSGAAWLSWMADLVPANSRGRYFGLRNMIMGIVTICTSMGAGYVLDDYKIANALEQGYFVVVAVAVICGIIAFGFMIRQPEPPYQRIANFSFKHHVIRPFRAKKFRKLLSFYLSFTFAVGIATSFFPVYLLKTLQWSFSNLALLAIGNSLMTLISQPFWGRIIDGVGHKPVIKTTMLGIIPLPLVYIFATPQHSWIIWLDILFTGLFLSGFNLAMLNMVFYSLPGKGRTGFLAVYSALTGLMSFFAMIGGGALAQVFSRVQFSIFGYTIINYHLLFALTFIFRISVYPLINRLEEPEAKSVSAMVGKIFLTINRHIGLGRSV